MYNPTFFEIRYSIARKIDVGTCSMCAMPIKLYRDVVTTCGKNFCSLVCAKEYRELVKSGLAHLAAGVSFSEIGGK